MNESLGEREGIFLLVRQNPAYSKSATMPLWDGDKIPSLFFCLFLLFASATKDSRLEFLHCLDLIVKE